MGAIRRAGKALDIIYKYTFSTINFIENEFYFLI
jgi:molybdenum-dependent DNA-binding transcriptional regulator ModE